MTKTQKYWLFTLVLPLLLGACSSQTEKKELGPEDYFQQAEEDLKDEHFITAREKYRDLKNRFPYSARAVDSELRIADSYFAEELFIEAESAYGVFQELHPTHLKRDYVAFRYALSQSRQIPDNPARDLTSAYKSIDSFESVIAKFPKSPYVEKARKGIMDARRKLAEHERYVADFYFQRQHFLSSSYRYASLLRRFPDMGFAEEALYRLGECYYHIRMFGNARDALGQLLRRFPKTDFEGAAKSLLEDMQEA